MLPVAHRPLPGFRLLSHSSQYLLPVRQAKRYMVFLGKEGLASYPNPTGGKEDYGQQEDSLSQVIEEVHSPTDGQVRCPRKHGPNPLWLPSCNGRKRKQSVDFCATLCYTEPVTQNRIVDFSH